VVCVLVHQPSSWHHASACARASGASSTAAATKASHTQLHGWTGGLDGGGAVGGSPGGGVVGGGRGARSGGSGRGEGGGEGGGGVGGGATRHVPEMALPGSAAQLPPWQHGIAALASPHVSPAATHGGGSGGEGGGGEGGGRGGGGGEGSGGGGGGGRGGGLGGRVVAMSAVPVKACTMVGLCGCPVERSRKKSAKKSRPMAAKKARHMNRRQQSCEPLVVPRFLGSWSPSPQNGMYWPPVATASLSPAPRRPGGAGACGRAVAVRSGSGANAAGGIALQRRCVRSRSQ